MKKEKNIYINKGEEKIEVTQILALFIKVPNISGYWKVLKNKIKKESGYYSIEDKQKLYSKKVKKDGKSIDVITAQQFFRIIQSVPSKEVEEIKIWIAKKANESLKKEKEENLSSTLKNIKKLLLQK